jgi:hypothetical protein
MVIFGTLSKKVQGIVRKYLLSKKALDRAEAMNKKCRDEMIKEICQDKDITSETIFMGEEEVTELYIKGAPRSDTSWTGAWKEFDKLFFPLIENDQKLSGEYLRARRTAEINNKKSPYMRWEIRLKDGGGNGS